MPLSQIYAPHSAQRSKVDARTDGSSKFNSNIARTLDLEILIPGPNVRSMASAGDENQPPRAHVHRFAIPLQAARGQRITFRIVPGQVNN